MFPTVVLGEECSQLSGNSPRPSSVSLLREHEHGTGPSGHLTQSEQQGNIIKLIGLSLPLNQRLNMELDLPSLIGLHVTAVLIG